MKKFLLVYRQEGRESDQLFFSEVDGRNGPVWSGDNRFVLDDGTLACTAFNPVHFDKGDAETLAFNMVTYDKMYLDRLSVEECSFSDCKECSA